MINSLTLVYLTEMMDFQLLSNSKTDKYTKLQTAHLDCIRFLVGKLLQLCLQYENTIGETSIVNEFVRLGR